jgi:predicted nucleotidyltransferase
LVKKPITRYERLEVIYNRAHWKLLESLRRQAANVMEILDSSYISSIVHGSIARGDISLKSDIDIFIPQILPSFTIESVLKRANLNINKRILVQPTPTYSIRGYIEIDNVTSISFPLSKLRRTELEFYKYGGKASLTDLRRNYRKLGVDKRLMLIEPISKGHVESPIIGREHEVSSLLKVSAVTVLSRIHALIRRDNVGRTGLYIEREVLQEETFESVLKKLSDSNPSVRRRLKTV